MRVCEWNGNCMELLNESGDAIDGVTAANEKKGSEKKKKTPKILNRRGKVEVSIARKLR